MARIIVFLFALVAGGCGFRAADEIVISPEFTPEQQEEIVSAADEWCEVAGACVPVSVGEPANIVVAPADYCAGSGGARTNQGPTSDPTIEVCSKKVGEYFRIVVLHELGHFLSGNDEHLGDDTAMCSNNLCASGRVTDKDVDYVSM